MTIAAPLLTLLIRSLLFFALPGAGVVLLAPACVTVNVNFPESAVQQATDDYVKELYRAREKGKESEQPEPSASHLAPSVRIEFLIPSAHAEEETERFQVNTPKTLEIRDRLATRINEVLTHKRAGILGETQDGFLAFRSGTGNTIKPLLLKRIEKIVAEENQDRTELYQEVLKVNRLPESRLIHIQRSFARSFQSESPSGTWIQNGEGKWTRKS